MISTSISEKIPFTPPWRKEADAPIFYLRSAGVIERAQMEAELSGTLRAGRVYAFELRAAIVSGVQTLLRDDPTKDDILALLAAEQEDNSSLSEKEKQELTEVRSILEESWSEYRDLLAQMARRDQLAPIVALRRFCVGWDNVATSSGKPVAFALGFDGMVTDKVLAEIPELELRAAGNRAFSLQYLGEATEGNSSPPPPSDEGPQTSPSDDGSKAAGKSKASGTRKTRD